MEKSVFHQPHEEFPQLTRGICATGPVQSALPTPTQYLASSVVLLLMVVVAVVVVAVVVLLQSVRITNADQWTHERAELGTKEAKEPLLSALSGFPRQCEGLWGGKGGSRREEPPGSSPE